MVIAVNLTVEKNSVTPPIIRLNYCFQIPGKEWGDPNGHPWVCLHGWLDNCGTFDTLAPIFPKGNRLICYDIPGHGYSSHIPKGEEFA